MLDALVVAVETTPAKRFPRSIAETRKLAAHTASPCSVPSVPSAVPDRRAATYPPTPKPIKFETRSQRPAAIPKLDAAGVSRAVVSTIMDPTAAPRTLSIKPIARAITAPAKIAPQEMRE
jgi:hypothetical protein